jgi:transposase-like protein
VVSFKGTHFPQETILTFVRWYVAYPLSYRQVEELMQEGGVSVNHATASRWTVKCSPPLEAAFHRRKLKFPHLSSKFATEPDATRPAGLAMRGLASMGWHSA